jgi:hypothetical protein
VPVALIEALTRTCTGELSEVLLFAPPAVLEPADPPPPLELHAVISPTAAIAEVVATTQRREFCTMSPSLDQALGRDPT